MTTYYCDNKRHLVCTPYSVLELHKMAKKLKINRFWFHKKKNGLSHYDIPRKRIKEITNKCVLVSSKEIIKIIKNEYVEQEYRAEDILLTKA